VRARIVRALDRAVLGALMTAAALLLERELRRRTRPRP
jgi:hypothetical protein